MSDDDAKTRKSAEVEERGRRWKGAVGSDFVYCFLEGVRVVIASLQFECVFDFKVKIYRIDFVPCQT